MIIVTMLTTAIFIYSLSFVLSVTLFILAFRFDSPGAALLGFIGAFISLMMLASVLCYLGG